MKQCSQDNTVLVYTRRHIS